MKRLIASALLLLGLILAGGATAGASATSPGPGMGCTSGTDSCGGWVASLHDPTCQAYNVNWTHDWYASPGGDAYWHVVIDLWWNGGASCTQWGGAHKVATVADIYHPDYEVPHVNVIGGAGAVQFIGHQQSVGGVGTTGVTAWTQCTTGVPGTDASDVVITNYHGQTDNTWMSGFYSADTQGKNSFTNFCNTGHSGSDSHNGAYVAPNQIATVFQFMQYWLW